MLKLWGIFINMTDWMHPVSHDLISLTSFCETCTHIVRLLFLTMQKHSHFFANVRHLMLQGICVWKFRFKISFKTHRSLVGERTRLCKLVRCLHTDSQSSFLLSRQGPIARDSSNVSIRVHCSPSSGPGWLL